MTTAQQRRLYFPAWNAAAKNHGWLTKNPPPRVEFFGNRDINDLYQRIWTIALERAAAAASTPTGDSFRHACHLVAFGKDKSSSQLTNRELDRILALFKLLADPDDLAATLAWNNADESARKRLLWYLRNECVESYVVEICRQKFGTDDWEALDYADLRQLHMTLKNRPRAQRVALHGPAAQPAVINVNRELVEEPF